MLQNIQCINLASMMEKDIENILEKIKHIETNPLRDDYYNDWDLGNIASSFLNIIDRYTEDFEYEDNNPKVELCQKLFNQIQTYNEEHGGIEIEALFKKTTVAKPITSELSGLCENIKKSVQLLASDGGYCKSILNSMQHFKKQGDFEYGVSFCIDRISEIIIPNILKTNPDDNFSIAWQLNNLSRLIKEIKDVCTKDLKCQDDNKIVKFCLELLPQIEHYSEGIGSLDIKEPPASKPIAPKLSALCENITKKYAQYIIAPTYEIDYTDASKPPESTAKRGGAASNHRDAYGDDYTSQDYIGATNIVDLETAGNLSTTNPS